MARAIELGKFLSSKKEIAAADDVMSDYSG
jgi:hypothetical protein